MNELIEKLKGMGDQSQEKIEETINSYSYNQVMKDLEDAGIEPSELSDEELNDLVVEEVNKNKSMAKGVLAGAGTIMFLEFLG